MWKNIFSRTYCWKCFMNTTPLGDTCSVRSGSLSKCSTNSISCRKLSVQVTHGHILTKSCSEHLRSSEIHHGAAYSSYYITLKYLNSGAQFPDNSSASYSGCFNIDSDKGSLNEIYSSRATSKTSIDLPSYSYVKTQPGIRGHRAVLQSLGWAALQTDRGRRYFSTHGRCSSRTALLPLFGCGNSSEFVKNLLISPSFESSLRSACSILSTSGHRRSFSTSGLSSSSSSSRGSSLQTVEDVAAYITKEASSVLVMTGAGISTASGIPDFRSPKTGLYHNLQKYKLPYPEAIFDINFFMMDQRPFVALAQELYPGVKYRPNAAHFFLRLLQDQGKLRRVYTQNIDGLERMSGLSPQLLTEAHGSFASASCTLCSSSHDPETVKSSILHGPGAPQCGLRGCKGKVKPDIVFFGENLPQEFWRFEEDLHAIDLLLIMGTSLEVYPFASIAESARTSTPRVLLNNTRAGTLGTRPMDCVLQGDIVHTVTQLAAACGWQQHLHRLLDDDRRSSKEDDSNV